jgi:hypothetical protein
MFIAGYMGDDAAWREFPYLWLEAIGPQRKHLHMKDLRFTKLPVQRMLRRAALVPKQCGLIPVAAGVRLRDYVDLLTEEEDVLVHAAYMMCCKAVTVFAMRSRPRNERVEVVLERQDRYGWYAALELEKISEESRLPELLMEDGKTSKLASWRFVDKESTVLCEPADYLAYALLQHSRNKQSIKSRWTYPIIAATPEGFAGLVQREHAKGMIIGQKKEKVLLLIELLKQKFQQMEEQKRLEDGAKEP